MAWRLERFSDMAGQEYPFFGGGARAKWFLFFAPPGGTPENRKTSMRVFSIVWCVFIGFVWYILRLACGVVGAFGDVQHNELWHKNTRMMSLWCAALAAPALLYLCYLCFVEYHARRARKIKPRRELRDYQKSAEQKRQEEQQHSEEEDPV